MVVEFPIDKVLKIKIDLMSDKVMDKGEDDNELIIEGDTGSGKTNMSVGVAYLVSLKTGRPFGNENIFFDIDKAVDFAKQTREQIIIFDEPAFGGLKSEWRSKTQESLVKLLLTARVKRHFLIFNLVKFSKFKDDIIERATAFIRVYRRDESKQERRFLFIPKKNIPSLLELWHRKHIRAYTKFAVYRGTVFKYVLPEIINKEEYNKLKEESIAMIGEDKVKKKELSFMFKIGYAEQKLKDMGVKITHEQYCKAMNIAVGTTFKFRDTCKKHGFVESSTNRKIIIPDSIINNGEIKKKLIDSPQEERETPREIPEVGECPINI